MREYLLFLWWVGWPRHSILLATVLLLVGGIAVCFQKKRLAAVSMAVSVCFYLWYGWVVYVPRSLSPGGVRAIEIRTLGEPDVLGRFDGTSHEVRDVLSYFSSVRTVPGTCKIRSKYWISFWGAEGRRVYRVTEQGSIAEDVPASAIQDLYIPRKDGLAVLMQRLTRH